MAEEKRKDKIKDSVKELEKIVEYFEGEDIDLDEAIEKYEKAEKLVAKLNDVLKKYETKVREIAS